MIPDLSILVPCYNEAATLAACIERIEASPVDLEIIVVDDGSTDGSREILRALAGTRDPRKFRVVFHDQNRGKGAAIRTAIPQARGRVSLVQDADLEYWPTDYPDLIAPILAGRSKVVYGSRRLRKDNDYRFDIFLLGSLTLTALTNLLYGSRITDEPTCYKAFDTELLQALPLHCQGFEFCPEVTARVLRRGEHIIEVPIRYTKRTVAEGKKIRFRDAIIGAWTLIKYRIRD